MNIDHSEFFFIILIQKLVGSFNFITIQTKSIKFIKQNYYKKVPCEISSLSICDCDFVKIEKLASLTK